MRQWDGSEFKLNSWGGEESGSFVLCFHILRTLEILYGEIMGKLLISLIGKF